MKVRERASPLKEIIEVDSPAVAVARRVERQPIVVVLGALSLLTHLPGLLRHKITSDEASIATMAKAILAGGHLYTTIADRKPPLVPMIYAATFGVVRSTDIRPVRLVGAVAAAAAAVLVAREAERRYASKRVGLVAGVLFLLAVAALFPEDSQAATFEIFMLVPLVASVAAAGEAKPARAGLWLALAMLCKQTAAAAVLPVLFMTWRRCGWRRAALSLAVSGAVVGVVAALFGVQPFFLWTVTGNRGYLAVQGSVLNALWRGFGITVGVAAIELAPVGLALDGLRRKLVDNELVVYLLSGVLAVVAGLRFFGHYYLQLIPALALMAAATLVRPTRPWVSPAALSFAAIAATVMGVIALGGWGDAATAAYPEIAASVRRVSAPGDSLFVWGDVPEVYWASDRPPATRFVHTGFITGNSGGRPDGAGTASNAMPGASAMLLADFDAHAPQIIVDTSTTKLRQSNLYPLTTTALWKSVGAQYELATTVDGVRIYRRAGARP